MKFDLIYTTTEVLLTDNKFANNRKIDMYRVK